MNSEPPDSTDLAELHSLLANETRMGIMQTLWENFDFTDYVTEDQTGLAFAELRKRSSLDDSGNFNYHLGKLVGTLVTDRDDGYVLTPLGYNLMVALDRYREFEYETRDPWILENPCPFCGGSLRATYRRELLEIECRECGGLADSGNFTFVELPVTGTKTLDSDELLDAATVSMSTKIRAAMRGICWNCQARMQSSFDACTSHSRDETGICLDCDNRFGVTVDASCETCGTAGHGPVPEYALFSAPVQAFFTDASAGPSQFGPWEYRLTAFASITDLDCSGPPRTGSVEFYYEGSTCNVTLEEDDGCVVVTR